MCGFCGFTGKRAGLDESKSIIEGMASKIHHRGPDGHGYFFDGGIALGFRRLAFLDLEHGAQPMTSDCGRYTIAFNGEIYNYKKLQEDLARIGHSFKTNSDTEVLLALYKEHGVNMLEFLRGMFAFVVYDKDDGSIFAARDHFGIKPFYYGLFGDGSSSSLIFASEIKAMLPHPDFVKEVNVEALWAYLSFQYSPLNETFFKGVYKLAPGHYMKYCQKSGALELVQYWQPRFEPEIATPLNRHVDSIDTAMADSIAAHQLADVPIGSFLSSGVDSSYIASRFEGKKTFTVGFDYEGYNEIDYAKELSLDKGLEHFSKSITTDEYWQALPKIQYHMDEPLADPSAVALYFVSGLASGHVKGVLSGEGADELFGGYNIYKEPLALKPMQVLPRFARLWLAAIARRLPNFKGKNYLLRASQSLEERYIGNAKIFTDGQKEELLSLLVLAKCKKPTTKDITAPLYAKCKNYDQITTMQYLDMHFWLPGDILLKADKMTMAHSIEGRVPFLDKYVFDIAAKVPTKYRVNKKETKYAFRLAAANHLAPKWAKKRKLGFPVPIRLWLRQDEYYNKVKNAFDSEVCARYFNVQALAELLQQHKDMKADNSRKIWTIYMFLVWHEEFFEEIQ